MGEVSEVKEKSVLSQDEVDFLAGLTTDGEEGAQDRILLDRQKGLEGEERFRKVWDAWQNKNWETVLSVINKIPEDRDLDSLMMANFPGKPYVGSIARVSIGMLFKNADKHLTAVQVKLVGRVLMRMYPDGLGLGSEPWKAMFFESAKKFFPNSVGNMIEEVEKAGIDKSEYISEALRPTLLRILHNGNEEGLANALIEHGDLLTAIDEFYGADSFDPGEKERLLKAGDILLGRWYRAYGPLYIERACQVYEFLHRRVMAISERVEIARIRNRYCAKEFASSVCGDISNAVLVRLCEMRIRGKIRTIAKKFDIKII